MGAQWVQQVVFVLTLLLLDSAARTSESDERDTNTATKSECADPRHADDNPQCSGGEAEWPENHQRGHNRYRGDEHLRS